MRILFIIIISFIFNNSYSQYNLIKKSGFEFECFNGIGLYQGSISKYFKNHYNIGCVFDFYYKRWNIYLTDYIGFSRLKNDLMIKTQKWERNSYAEVFLPELSIGYVTGLTKYRIISPFVGFSFHHINSRFKNTGLEYTKTLNLGVNFDYRIKSPQVDKESKNKIRRDGLFLRLRYSLNIPQFNKEKTQLGGLYHIFTIGLGKSN